MQSGKRLEFIDSLKGFAIFSVVWGHSMQHLQNRAYAYHNPMFEFIYSFHMPLFFLISGFFFQSSLKLSYKKFIWSKGKQLLLPCFVWMLIFLLSKIIGALAYGESLVYKNELKILVQPFEWPFWFLRELFISYVLVYVSIRVLKKEWVAFVACIAFVLLAPHGSFQRFLMPIFWAGIYLRNNYQLLSAKANTVLIVSALLFVLSLCFWRGDYTIYITGFPALIHWKALLANSDTIALNTEMPVHLFRLMIGLSGSVFFFFLFNVIYTNNTFFYALGNIGLYTLAIYVLQSTLLEIWLNQWLDFSEAGVWLYDLLITPIVAFIVVCLCIAIVRILRKNTRVELLLFGSSYQKAKPTA